MKRVYWRPPGVSRPALLLIAVVAVVALLAVEQFPVQKKQRFYEEKYAAALLTREAFGVIKAEKVRRGISIDPEADPLQTGVIGQALSPVTSNTGYITAKRAAVNPNFAAVVVHLLKKANVEKGDTVAVGVSGSFPALNVATFAALQTLGLKPIVIASASSSEYGANDVDMLWIDMERVLSSRQLFGFRSVAASRGGIDDRGFGMSKEGRALLDTAIERNNLVNIESRSVVDAVEKRMQIYDQHAKQNPIKCYVNVGGGTASVGTHVGKKQFKPGLNLEPPRGEGLVDSVMLRFAEREVPVIHITQITQLAKQFGMKTHNDKIPPVGEGNVFVRAEYNRWLAGAGVLVILGVMLAFIRLDIGMRILRGARQRSAGTQPQQMI